MWIDITIWLSFTKVNNPFSFVYLQTYFYNKPSSTFTPRYYSTEIAIDLLLKI